MSKNPSPNTVSQKGSDFKDHFRYLMASRWARGNIVVGMQLGAADMIICHPFPPCRAPLFHGSDGPPPAIEGSLCSFIHGDHWYSLKGDRGRGGPPPFSFLPLHLQISRGRELGREKKGRAHAQEAKARSSISPFSLPLKKVDLALTLSPSLSPFYED